MIAKNLFETELKFIEQVYIYTQNENKQTEF